MGKAHQSVFISYGGPDGSFAEYLRDELKRNGISAFVFTKDAEPGAKLHRIMRDGVNQFDRVILVCSERSLNRPGVLNEIEETLQREAREGGRSILIPLSLDDYVFGDWAPERPDIALAVRDRVVADFRGITLGDSIAPPALDRLVKALRKRSAGRVVARPVEPRSGLASIELESAEQHLTRSVSIDVSQAISSPGRSVAAQVDLDDFLAAKVLNIRAKALDWTSFRASAASVGISMLNFTPPSQIRFIGAGDGAFVVLLDIQFNDPGHYQSFVAILPTGFLEPLLTADLSKTRAQLVKIRGRIRHHLVSVDEGISCVLVVESALIADAPQASAKDIPVGGEDPKGPADGDHQDVRSPLCGIVERRLGFDDDFRLLNPEERILLGLSSRPKGVTMTEASNKFALSQERLLVALEKLASHNLVNVEDVEAVTTWRLSGIGEAFLKNNPWARQV